MTCHPSSCMVSFAIYVSGPNSIACLAANGLTKKEGYCSKYIPHCMRVEACAILLQTWTQPSITYLLCTTVRCSITLSQACRAAYTAAVSQLGNTSAQLLSKTLNKAQAPALPSLVFAAGPSQSPSSSTLTVRVDGKGWVSDLEGLYLCDSSLWVLKSCFHCICPVPCHALLGQCEHLPTI